MADIVPINPEIDYLEGLAKAETSYDVFRVLKSFCLKFGFKTFLVMRKPDGQDAGISDLAIITNWPPELIGGYDALGIMSRSPVFVELNKSTRPYVWRFETIEVQLGKDTVQSARDLFSEFGINNGVYFSTVGPAGQRGALGLTGERSDPSQDELIEMNYIANHAFEALCNLDISKIKTESLLTEREQECVYWTACGKTSAEVGIVLSISDNTVNNYLASAAKKLSATNKAHTVAKAIRLGLLDKF